MNYIVDTHVLLWIIFSPKKISKKARIILVHPDLIKLVSVISLWEISLKFSLKKINLRGIQPENIPNVVKTSRIEILNLKSQIASTYHKLPYGKHKDPFDRMLAWQAIREECVLLTADKDFAEYKELGLKVVW